MATPTVTAEDPWRSVVAQGPLRRVPDTDKQLAANAIAENATVPTSNVSLDTLPEELTIDFYQLDPEKAAGRRFGGVADIEADDE